MRGEETVVPVPDRGLDRQWSRVLLATVGLLVASLVPSPLERRSDWRWVGPDKVLHLLGHAGYVHLLADALDSGTGRAGTAAPVALCLSTAQSVLAGVLQERVPGRAFERGDVVWAFVGSVLGAISWSRVDTREDA